MPGLGTITSVISQIWTALSGQLESYFKQPGKFSGNVFVPALAFLIGLYVILLGLVGSSPLRNWWNGLEGILQLLFVAMLVAVLTLLAELGRILTTTVRQVYSGDLPRWQWWGRHGRRPFMQTFEVLQSEDLLLNRCEIRLNQALKKISTLQSKRMYPVLMKSLDAFQAIDGNAITFIAKPPNLKNTVQKPSELVGKYTIAPVSAKEPIRHDNIKPLPDKKYLDTTERDFVPLSVTPDDHALEDGRIVSLYLLSRSWYERTIVYDDLFVLHRQDPNTVLLSVPRRTVMSILELMRKRSTTWLHKAATFHSDPVGLPVAAHVVYAGRPISCADIAWTALGCTVPSTAIQEVHSIEGKVYVPSDLSLDKDAGVLQQGAHFQTEQLCDVYDSSVLSWNEGKQTHHRVPVRIDRTNQSKVKVEDGITTGDLITVCFDDDQSNAETACYVFRSDGKQYDVAVKNRDSFKTKFTAANKVLITRDRAELTLDEEVNKLETAIKAADAKSYIVINQQLSMTKLSENSIEQEINNIDTLVIKLLALNGRLHTRLSSNAGHLNPLAAIVERFNPLPDQLRTLVKRWTSVILRLEEQRRTVTQFALPETLADVRPTRLGNILVAATQYPMRAYQIDATIMLPKLLDVLSPSEPVVQRLINAEATLNMLLLLSFGSAVWTVLGATLLLVFGGMPWIFACIVLIGPTLWWLTKEAACIQAYVYGDAIKSLFDLRRRALFTQLGIILDEDALSPEEEGKYWRMLGNLFIFGEAERGFPKLKPTATAPSVSTEKKT